MKCSQAKFITEHRLLYIERIKPDLGKNPHIFSSLLPACFPARVAGVRTEPLAREAALARRPMELESAEQAEREGLPGWAGHRASLMLLSFLGWPKNVVGVGRSEYLLGSC